MRHYFNTQSGIDAVTYAAIVRKDTSEQKLKEDAVMDIIEAVARVFDISVEDITGTRRIPEFVYPRQIAMYLCRHKTEAGLKEIGAAFNKDHTTVIYAIKCIGDYLYVKDKYFIVWWEKWEKSAPKYLL